MAKLRKSAFGVAEDGLFIKLVNLSREGNQISLQALEQIELERSLYHHADEAIPDVELPATDDINLDDFTTDNVASYKIQPYETLFQTYSLNQGIIAINTFEEHLLRLPLVSPIISQKQKNKLVKENIPRFDYKSGQYQSSVVSINDMAELWIHHGVNRLHDILEESANTGKYKFFYQLADANETALASLFLLNQSLYSDETHMILYLGNEYKRALLFENKKWTFSLPIHVSQHQSDIDIIYSKLSLALDEAHITDPKKLLICGDMCNEEAIVFLRNQLPNSDVEIWKLPSLFLDSDVAQAYDENLIARFILPIALAWKALCFENPAIVKSNFLPSLIIEGQKVFKIAWHGYVALTILFLSALYMTRATFKSQFELQQEKMNNKELFNEYSAKSKMAEKMMTMAKAIDIQTVNIEVIKTLLAGKNPWTEIISGLNNCFQNHPTSWLTNLRRSPTGFVISGVTTNRANVVEFSNLFPNGVITKVNNRKIHSASVWEFEINYDYPAVNWFEMMEADVQQLRNYQSKQSEKQADKKTPNQTEVKSQNQPQNTDSKTEQNTDTTPTPTPKPEKQKQSVQHEETVSKSQHQAINMPVPAKSLLVSTSDPSVRAYNDFIAAYNMKQDKQSLDLGVKFINNYPTTQLKSYVKYYLGYRAWQKKQYAKSIVWLDPIISSSDVIKPNALLLIGMVYRDSGDKKKADEYWKLVLQDFPQHQSAKDAKKFIDEN